MAAKDGPGPLMAAITDPYTCHMRTRYSSCGWSGTSYGSHRWSKGATYGCHNWSETICGWPQVYSCSGSFMAAMTSPPSRKATSAKYLYLVFSRTIDHKGAMPFNRAGWPALLPYI